MTEPLGEEACLWVTWDGTIIQAGRYELLARERRAYHYGCQLEGIVPVGTFIASAGGPPWRVIQSADE